MYPVLLDSIRIGAPFRQQSPDYPHGMFIMAVEQILPHKIPLLLILFRRPVIHIDDNPILIANRNAAIQPFSPIWYHNHLVLTLSHTKIIFLSEKQLVPRKRFRRYKAIIFLSFVPIKRFIRYKIVVIVLRYVTLANSCKEFVPSDRLGPCGILAISPL